MSSAKPKAPSLGLRQLTRAGSIPMRVAPGGKEMIRDTSKERKYKVKGEKPSAERV